jgi:uncharacterized membrane protein YcaP (DUF421 family)
MNSALLGIFLPSDWGKILVPDTPLLEIVARGSIIYLSLFFALRVVLKREAAGLGISDLLVVVLLADAVQNGMAGTYSSIPDALVIAATILGWDWFLAVLAFHFPSIRWVIHPRPIPLIRDGQLVEKNVRHELLTHEELMGQLREQGIERIEDVKVAFMESNGLITCIPRKGLGEPKHRRQAS